MPVAMRGEAMDQQLELLSRDRTRHNVYLAALPDAPMAACAEEIAGNMRQRFGLTAKPISPEHLHVSLLAVGDFSGSCPPAVIDAALRGGGAVSMAPFRVEFNRFASFSGGRGKRALVVTGDEDGVAGFVMLRGALSQALMKAV